MRRSVAGCTAYRPDTRLYERVKVDQGPCFLQAVYNEARTRAPRLSPVPRARVVALSRDQERRGVCADWAARSVLGSWVGVRRLFHHSLILTASRMVLPQDASTTQAVTRRCGAGQTASLLAISDKLTAARGQGLRVSMKAGPAKSSQCMQRRGRRAPSPPRSASACWKRRYAPRAARFLDRQTSGSR